MARYMQIYNGRVPDDPECNRSVMPHWDWVALKEAIDVAREDVKDSAAQKVLMSYGLWDTFNGCPNEKKIKLLYMRNA